MSEVSTSTKNKLKIPIPKQYSVLLLNDDFTTMDFVVFILVTVFSYSESDAQRLMMRIHETGSAVCGSFIYEIAVAKLDMVHRLAQASGFPLKGEISEES